MCTSRIDVSARPARHHAFYAALMITLALLVHPSAFAEKQPSVAYLENFNCAEGPFRLRLPRTYPALRTIGRLRSEKIARTENWDTYKTYDRILTFDGLWLDLTTFSADKSRYLISRVRITSPRWRFAGGFRVGDSADAAAARLGVSRSRDMISVSSDADFLAIRVAHGKIKQIEYSCYTG